jgi:XTP/dITP diphosphohydrolase
MRVIFASHNENKVAEIRQLLPKDIELLSLKDINFVDEIEENGATLEENSALKAKTIFIKTGIPTIADDTGLEVFALNMEPGVFSARYAGNEKSDEANIEKLLDQLRSIHDRKARFRTIFTYCASKTLEQFEGIVEGEIGTEKMGSNGFGYDPVFFPECGTRTFAEMTLEEKNQISHRARALQKLVSYFFNSAK